MSHVVSFSVVAGSLCGFVLAGYDISTEYDVFCVSCALRVFFVFGKTRMVHSSLRPFLRINRRFGEGGNPVAIEKCSAATRKKLVVLDSDRSYEVCGFLLATVGLV